MIEPISKVWNADCVEGMQQFEDDFFDWAIVDIEYCLGASKPTKKPNKVKQKNGNEIYLNVSAMSSGGFGTTHFKFSTNDKRKHKTSRKH